MRQAILRSYGVELILSDPLEGSDGAIRKVREIYAADPDRYFFADQYNNPANWQAHYEGTGGEIWRETEGRVTHFVAGLGTSGTMTGAGRRLREENPGVNLVAFQPNSPFHGLEGLKHMPTAIVPGIYDQALPETERRPACVLACPTNARLFGDVHDPDSEISTAIREQGGYQLMPEWGTKPANHYLPRRKTRINIFQDELVRVDNPLKKEGYRPLPPDDRQTLDETTSW